MTNDPRYPIGKFPAKEAYTQNERSAFLDRIASLPTRLESAIHGLTNQQLDTPYRDGGWTVRQVVHHVADSHMNAYIRVKWTLTESSPTIKAYEEKGWAVTPETTSDPSLSIALLKALHNKWIILFRGLSADDLRRDFIHPSTKKSVKLEHLMGMYAWHGDHHLAHITELKKQQNW